VVVEAFYLGGAITAYQLWDVLSYHLSPIPFDQARQIYRNLGFKPFAGYPLQRGGNFR